MYKIAIIGDRESVLGFMALGFSVHEAANADEARIVLNDVSSNEEYAIIFIVEEYAMALKDEIDKFKNKSMPAIISLPGQKGSTGYGMASIKSAVERAVGADILFKD